MLFFAPSQLSLFWPVTDDYYDYLPQSMFSAFSALACVVVALDARGAKPTGKFSSVAWCVLGFAVWVVLSVFGAVYRHDALLETARVVSVGAWFFIARTVLKKQGTVEFERACVWVFGAVMLGAVWVATASALGFLRTRAPQLSPWFTNVNLFANFCAMALPMALGFAVLVRRMSGARGWIVALPLLGAAWIALGLLASASKGGLLAALCGIAAFGIVMLRARGDAVRNAVRKRRALAIFLAIVLVGGGGVVGARTVLPRILAARGSQNHSTMFRVYTWRAAAEMAQRRPVVGFGAGAFPWAGQKFSQVGFTRIAHQSWLQIAGESGVPALLFLLGATVLALRRGWRAAKKQVARWPVVAGASGAVVAFAAHAMTDAGWGIVSVATLFIVALAILDACDVSHDETSTVEFDRTHSASAPTSPRGFLAWLGLALVLGGASWMAQRAATGEDERRLSHEAAARGETARALELATAATRSDPLGVRMWTNLAQAHEKANQNPDEWWARAVAVCPLGAQVWRQWAASRVRRGLDAEEQFARSIEIAPRDTETRQQRAQWRMAKNDARALEDWNAIAALARAPYGRFAATPEIVDLNYARALVEIARDDIRRGRRVEAAARLRDATTMLKQAQMYETKHGEFIEAARGAGALQAATEERETLQAQTRELQAQLK